MVYTVGRTIQADEQIFLNYGPKTNEDLLSHFGFTLPNNRCDVLHMSLLPTAHIHGNTVNNQVFKIQLYEGCLLATALNTARASVVKRLGTSFNSFSIGDISTVYHVDAPEADSSAASVAGSTGGSSSLWFAKMMQDEKQETITIDFSTIGRVISKANEREALETLEQMLMRFKPSSHPIDGDSFALDVAVYTNGQHQVAASVLGQIVELKKNLL